MKLSNTIKEYIINHARDESPRECCGLIIEINNKLKAIKCENVAYNKKDLFEISALDYISISKLGKVAGYYHSHTENNNEFSIMDKQISIVNDLPLVMYCTQLNEFKVY
tara:strand:- start:226 stop:552 length:327 start_codon:yes stop_codon:yes gene_type:complete